MTSTDREKLNLVAEAVVALAESVQFDPVAMGTPIFEESLATISRSVTGLKHLLSVDAWESRQKEG